MTKDYRLEKLSVGSCFGWQIVSNSLSDISVKLKGNGGRLYFSDIVSGKAVQVPNSQGADICNDTDLSLTVACDDKFDLKPLSHDLLSDDGLVIGHAFHYNGSVDGKPEEYINIVITVWNREKKELSEKEFIAECFYKYLSKKDRYLFNYVSDTLVDKYYNDMENERREHGSINYKEWFDDNINSVDSPLNQYKLIFAILLNYDKYCKESQLSYFLYKNIVIAFGKKQWNERKLTVGSCPFQNIRGIILNEVELEEFNKVEPQLCSETLFENGVLKAAASHAYIDSELSMEATRGLNFENIGLYVSAKQSEQGNIITESVKEADEGQASILIFPELSINQDQLETLKSELKATSHLKLVVAGSYYKGVQGSAYKNVSTIYAKIKGAWEAVAEYNKLIPFSMGYTKKVADAYKIDTTKYPIEKYKLLTEDIEMNDNITLLPYKDCVLGIAICRDAMDLLDSHNPLHKYCDFVDIMLVISDNAGDSNMFVGTAECLARWHNCATVYTNSIHEAGTNPEEADSHLEISFALYPYKGTNVSSSTSVSGEINYARNPFSISKLNSELERIIFSPGIKYNGLDADKCCKIYEIKAAKYT